MRAKAVLKIAAVILTMWIEVDMQRLEVREWPDPYLAHYKTAVNRGQSIAPTPEPSFLLMTSAVMVRIDFSSLRFCGFYSLLKEDRHDICDFHILL